MKLIPLSQYRFAQVDDADYERVSKYKWTYDKRRRGGYAFRRGPRPQQIKIYLHRELMEAAAGVEVDHEDGDGLNNQRYNLRTATSSQNSANRRAYFGRSKFKGVAAPDKKNPSWRAYIWGGDNQIWLGVFSSEELAARAYDEAAREKWGRFARLNFP